MKLDWYIARLRNMAPAEIVHRLVEQARRRLERRRSGNWDRWAPLTVGALPGFAERVLSAGRDDRALVAAAAEETLGGRFAALGRHWPARVPGALFPAALWRLDPVTGDAWPGADVYCFDIDFRHDGRRGDVKYVWEINRLQFLPPLAAHYCLSGDERALAPIAAAVTSWMAANPPFQGVAWASGIEVALRAISLILVVAVLGDALPAATRMEIGQVLAASRHWLATFPSRFSSANNHRIAELAGLSLIALASAGSPDAAAHELADEIGKQIHADGSGAEQSPTYAAFSAELALLCAVATRDMGLRLAPILDERLRAFAEFAGWLGGGEPLRFGDDDEGRAVSGGVAEADYPRSVAAAVAACLGQPGPALASDFRGLLLGRPPTRHPAPAGLRTFAGGGLSIWHGELAGRNVRLGFDHGPLGYLAIAAHGHADALAVSLSIDGINVLVDPGTYLYGSGGNWRTWFRSTPAHNTLNLDGESQSLVSGAFNWSHKARAKLLDSAVGDDGWQLRGRHDGYVGRFGVMHERDVALGSGAVVITDRLTGGAPRHAELAWQLAPGLTARAEGAMVTVSAETGPLCRLTFPTSAITIETGGRVPGEGGAVSPAFGILRPAPRIAWRGEVGETDVTTRIEVLTR